MNYTKMDDYIQAIRLLSKNKLYIAGAGKYGEILGQYFDKHGIPWVAYADKRKMSQQTNGKRTYTYEDLDLSEGYYVISTYIHRQEIMQELINRDVEEDRIIVYEDQEIFYDVYDDLIHWKKHTDRIKDFYRKHEGKRCFVIGNGPSLRTEDLERLKDDLTFASNSIYAVYSSTNWRPTYYCAWDPIFCREIMSEKQNMSVLMDGCEAAFTSILGEGMQYRDDIDMRKLYYMRTISKKSENKLPLFSSDCCEQVYAAGSITYGMLQLAVYMGFTQIYLLGMDFSYSVEQHEDDTIVRNNVCNHMEEIEKEEAKRFYKKTVDRHGDSYVASIDLQLAGFQAAKEYTDAHNIKIYNATRGGKLEVFERVNFDSLF
ncbi:MAG: DUF115 domain-containing protein [Ruminococcus flavefaciens]|nr:DUF115 domain-containing protein [Ruminococcus flavefaciens]